MLLNFLGKFGYTMFKKIKVLTISKPKVKIAYSYLSDITCIVA